MKQATLFSIQLALVISLVGFIACSDGGDKAEATGSSGKITVGSSCEGIGPMEGKLACEGNKTLFCSSYSKYKYQVHKTCPEGQTCKMTADGKAAQCVSI